MVLNLHADQHNKLINNYLLIGFTYVPAKGKQKIRAIVSGTGNELKEQIRKGNRIILIKGKEI